MKKKHYILLGILCLFIITNPSISSFKAFIGKTDDNYKRTSNFFIFSTYRWHSSYIGVLGNFFRESSGSYGIVNSTDNINPTDTPKYDEYGIPPKRVEDGK